MHENGCLSSLGYIAAWLILATLAGITGWYLLVALLAVAGWLIESPWRPYAWNSSSLIAINKLSMLILIGMWLMLVVYLEQDLRQARFARRLVGRALVYATVLLAVTAASYGIAILLQ